MPAMSNKPASTKEIGDKVRKQICRKFDYENIVRCVVRNCGERHPSHMTGDPYWYCVAELCGISRQAAIDLCELLDVNPHQRLQK
jgi:hypothetical protein